MKTNNTTDFRFLRNFTPNSTIRIKNVSGNHIFENLITLHYRSRGD